MKRRNFIKNAGIATIGLSIVPLEVFSADSRVQMTDFELMETQNHVRHGSFNQQEGGGVQRLEQGPKWFKGLEIHRFFDNGYAETSKDLLNISLLLNAQSPELYQVSCLQDQLLITSDDKQELVSFAKSGVKRINKSVSIIQLQHAEQMDFSRFLKQEGIFLLLRGEAHINDYELNIHRAAWQKGDGSLRIRSLKTPLICLYLSSGF